jgi:hypothetical protein
MTTIYKRSARARSHTQTHTRTHTCTRKHIHAHIHKHTLTRHGRRRWRTWLLVAWGSNTIHKAYPSLSIRIILLLPCVRGCVCFEYKIIIIARNKLYGTRYSPREHVDNLFMYTPCYTSQMLRRRATTNSTERTLLSRIQWERIRHHGDTSKLLFLLLRCFHPNCIRIVHEFPRRSPTAKPKPSAENPPRLRPASTVGIRSKKTTQQFYRTIN